MKRILCICLLISACQNENAPIDISSDKEQNIQKTDFAGDSVYFEIIQSIDADTTLFRASSLEYSDKEGQTYQSEGLIDANNKISKLKAIISGESQETIDEFYYINDQGCPCMYASIIIIRKIQLVPAYIYYHLQLMTYRHSVQVCDRLSPLDRSRRWRARV